MQVSANYVRSKRKHVNLCLLLRTEAPIAPIIKRDLTLQAGALGNIVLPAGRYVYVGSARTSISGWTARHRRLAETKTGKLHWHIDYLLTHIGIDLVRADAYPGCRECDLAHRIESMRNASAPAPRFGSSDCRSGCSAHLFRVGKSGTGGISSISIQREP
jgi:Uri superfamily endonuclease